ncbi:MAG TPA: hypothetical protein ENK08_05040 [Chloroflexi bacterium]|nr:hypothetical protein [Chloroflexota bacterium]
MKVNTSMALKAGLIGAAAGLVVALLGRIPFIGCIIGPLGWAVAVAAGTLYVHYAAEGGRKVEIGEGALGGALAGGIAGLAQSLVSGILILLFGPVRAAASLLGRGQVGAAAISAGVTLVSVIGGIVGGTIIGAALGALGGVIYTAVNKK